MNKKRTKKSKVVGWVRVGPFYDVIKIESSPPTSFYWVIDLDEKGSTIDKRATFGQYPTQHSIHLLHANHRFAIGFTTCYSRVFSPTNQSANRNEMNNEFWEKKKVPLKKIFHVLGYKNKTRFYFSGRREKNRCFSLKDFFFKRWKRKISAGQKKREIKRQTIYELKKTSICFWSLRYLSGFIKH